MGNRVKQNKSNSDSGSKLLFANGGIRAGSSRSFRKKESDRTVQASV